MSNEAATECRFLKTRANTEMRDKMREVNTKMRRRQISLRANNWDEECMSFVLFENPKDTWQGKARQYRNVARKLTAEKMGREMRPTRRKTSEYSG